MAEKSVSAIMMIIELISWEALTIVVYQIKNLKEAVKNINCHFNVGSRILVRQLHLETMDSHPLFNVMFAWQSEKMTEIIFADRPVQLLPIPVTTAKYDITFNIMKGEEKVIENFVST